MKFKQFTITEDCIGCMACVGVSEENFSMNDENKAFVIKQPETEDEEEACQQAADVCPVSAIIEKKAENVVLPEPVIATSNIYETLEKYPELKEVLIKLSPKFKRMQNPVVFNTLARFANFKDAAKMTGISVCEILHTINKFLGVEERLIKAMPECIKGITEEKIDFGEPVTWEESNERYIWNEHTTDELIEKISRLKPQENLVIISVESPDILIKAIKGLNFKFNLEKNRDYRLSVFNPEKLANVPWRQRKDDFEVLDVRTMTSDPFDIIIQKAYEVSDDSGFILVQRFVPYPLINMLTEMGFEYEVEQSGYDEVRVYFYKIPVEKSSAGIVMSKKPEVVIQSATPVAYPVIMKLLQSDVIRSNLKIKQLKVWEETEKHLGWIVNKKADISFSAVITSLKLTQSDVKIPAVFVWDNFVLLTRGYKARDFSDLLGKEIHTPLFADAPPAKITKYLIKASGLNPEDFKFKFGKPFGRPEEIYRDFVLGYSDTVILREPEASYAVSILDDQGVDYSEISYNEIWNKINPGFGSFPNAGLVFKGEFYRKYPELAELFLEELKKTIEWINRNKTEASELAFDIMRQPPERVERFLNRVNFNYMYGEPLLKKIEDYFSVLLKEEIIQGSLSEEFLNMFVLK